MLNRVYLDTNIVIDLMDSTRPNAKNSYAIVNKMISEGVELYINPDSATNAFYILNKQKKYTYAKLLQIIRKVISLFVTVCVEQKDIFDALTLCEDETTDFKDYEDALQYICAKKIDADLIVSNDKGFVSSDIKIQTSTELYE